MTRSRCGRRERALQAEHAIRRDTWGRAERRAWEDLVEVPILSPTALRGFSDGVKKCFVSFSGKDLRLGTGLVQKDENTK